MDIKKYICHSSGPPWGQLLRARHVRPGPRLQPALPPPVQEGRHPLCREHHVQWGSRYLIVILYFNTKLFFILIEIAELPTMSSYC